MDELFERLQELSKTISKNITTVKTEEATKNAFIMPFINLLGYNVFNPTEVIPELTADVGNKKGEKVDYAIKKGDDILMLIECKGAENELNNTHCEQLLRYFSVTNNVPFGILTNGIKYRFFSDIDQTSTMDTEPFFEFDILNFEKYKVGPLLHFTKSRFSLEKAKTYAEDLKYERIIKKILIEELENPSKEFVTHFAHRIFKEKAKRTKLTKTRLEQFTKIVKEARNKFIEDKIQERLKEKIDNERLKPVSLLSNN